MCTHRGHYIDVQSSRTEDYVQACVPMFVLFHIVSSKSGTQKNGTNRVEDPVPIVNSRRLNDYD